MTMQPEVSYGVDVSLVAQYLIALDSQRPTPDMTPLKLQKLLYLVQANYLAATGHRLFDAPIEAFEHGPVVYTVYKEYEPFKSSVITPDHASDGSDSLPQDARDFIEAVWTHHQDSTPAALWALTHAQTPWSHAYEPGAFRKQIPDDAMRDYFRHEVPPTQRVMHPNVVVVDRGFLDDLDDAEDEIVAQAVSALS